MILETSISRWDWQSNNVTRSLSLHTTILQTSRDCKSSNITVLHGSQPRMRTELLRQKSLLQDAADFVAKQDSCLKSRLTKLYKVDKLTISCQHNDNVKPKDCSPPARWGLLDFMSVASSSCLPPASSSSFRRLLPPAASCRLLPRSPPLRHPRRPRRPRCPRPTAIRDPQCSLPDLNHDHPRPVFPAGPQPRPSTPSVPCRTSTATIPVQCSLPDLNREYPRQVFPAGPHVGRYAR